MDTADATPAAPLSVLLAELSDDSSPPAAAVADAIAPAAAVFSGPLGSFATDALASASCALSADAVPTAPLIVSLPVFTLAAIWLTTGAPAFPAFAAVPRLLAIFLEPASACAAPSRSWRAASSALLRFVVTDAAPARAWLSPAWILPAPLAAVPVAEAAVLRPERSLTAPAAASPSPLARMPSCFLPPLSSLAESCSPAGSALSCWLVSASAPGPTTETMRGSRTSPAWKRSNLRSSC